MRELSMDEMDVVSGGKTDYYRVAQSALREGFNNVPEGAFYGGVRGAYVGTFFEPGGGTLGGAILGTATGGIYGFIEGFLRGGTVELIHQNSANHSALPSNFFGVPVITSNGHQCLFEYD